MASIVIGTTPTIIFNGFSQVRPPDFERAILSLVQPLSLVHKNAGSITIKRELDTATVTESAISWTLTQEETLRLVPILSEQRPGRVKIVLNYLTAAGLRGTSKPIELDVIDNPVREVLT